MEAFNVIEDIGSRLGRGLIETAVHTFWLKHAEEAFGRGIVAAVDLLPEKRSDQS